jgi:TP901 family phage tail tape measure protein
MSIKVTDMLIVLRSDTGSALAGMRLAGVGLAALGVGAVAVAGLFVKMGMDAQTQLSIVQGLTGSNAAQMQFYTAQLEQMAIRTGTTLADEAKGLYYVVSAGFQGANAINVLNYSQMAAKASGADLADVAHGLAGGLNAYGAGASQAGKYTDIMTAAVTDGMQTYQEFASEMGAATAVAANAHVPFLQLAAAEAVITDKGLPAASAFAGLAFSMAKVMVPSSQMAKSFAALHAPFDAANWDAMTFVQRLNYMHSSMDATDFTKLIGGTRSSKAALDLVNDSGKMYNATLAHMQSQTGITQSAFDTYAKTLGADFDQVKAAVSVAGYALVTWIGPEVSPLIQKLAGAVQFLGQVFSLLAPQVTSVSAPVSDLHTHMLDMNTEMGRSYTAAAKLTVVQQVAAWLRDMGDKVTYVKNNWAQFEPWLVIGAAVIGGILVAAFLAWAAAAAAAAIATIAATWPVIAIGIAIGLLVAALVWAYQNWGFFRGAVDMARTGLGIMIGNIGDTIGVMGHLASMVGSNVGNAFHVLGGAIQQVGNLFGWIGGQVGNLLGMLGRLGAAIANIHMPSLGGLGGIHIPGFAEGGVMPGGAAMVGEHGAELALFPQGTRIIPHAQTQALMSGGSGSGGGGSSGGYRTAVIQVLLDGRVLAQSLPQPLVDRIRVATGLRV